MPDAAEGVHEVRREAGRSGHESLHAIGRAGLDHVAELLDLLAQLIRGRNGDDELDSLAVFRRDRAHDGAAQLECLNVGLQLGCFAELCGCEG
jgi:hypothetical protein